MPEEWAKASAHNLTILVLPFLSSMEVNAREMGVDRSMQRCMEGRRHTGRLSSGVLMANTLGRREGGGEGTQGTQPSDGG